MSRLLTSVIVCMAMVVMSVPGIASGANRGASPISLGQHTTRGISPTVATTAFVGQVTDADTGLPIEYASVEVDAGGAYFVTTSDEEGNYVLDIGFDYDTDEEVPLPAGTHGVSFWADGYEDTYVQATAVSGVSTVVDAELTPVQEPGGLGVHVYDANDEPFDFWVSVYREGPDGMEFVDGGMPDSDLGGYVGFRLEPGTYYVWANAPGHLSEYYNDAIDLASATPVEVVSGGDEVIDMDLSWDSMSGYDITVLDSETGAPLNGIAVTLEQVGPLGEDVWSGYEYGTTGADGHAKGAIGGGDWRVSFEDVEEGVYAGEYYRDTLMWEAAEIVEFTAGITGTLTGELEVAGSVTGTNFDSENHPYPALDGGESVDLLAWSEAQNDWVSVYWFPWNEDGTYQLTGIHPGTYRAVSYRWDLEAYEEEVSYYTSSGTPVESAANADDVVVTADGLVEDIDFHFDSYVPIPEVPVERVQGTNRYTTAIETSKVTFDAADTVVLATGANFPDALSASALAGAYGGPLLLTEPKRLTAGVAAEIERLGATNVVIIGSQAAVSASVADQLADMDGVWVERVYGDNRYETSAEIAYRVAEVLGEDYLYEAFLVRGDNFADALAASPIAYRNSMPVILTKPTTLSTEAYDVLVGLGVEHVVVAGSTNAVSATVVTQVESLSSDMAVERVFGTDRYSTSAELAAWGVDNGYVGRRFIGIATGTNFPDALGGGAACGANNGVLLLTNPTALSGPAESFITKYGTAYTQVQIFGSTKAVTDAVKSSVTNALQS